MKYIKYFIDKLGDIKTIADKWASVILGSFFTGTLFIINKLVSFTGVVSECSHSLVSYILNQFNLADSMIQTGIIPYKTAIMAFCIAFLTITSGIAIILYCIKIIRFFKSYIFILKGRAVLLSGQVASFFTKDFYKRIYLVADRVFSIFVIRVLEEIWPWIKGISFFRDPYIIQYKIIQYFKKISRYTSPVFGKFIKQIFRIGGNKEQKEDLFTILNEGMEPVKTEQLPEAIYGVFKENKSLYNFYSAAVNEMTATLIDRWERGNFSSLFLVGSPGSGKTSFLELIRQRFPLHKMYYHRIQRGENLFATEPFKSLQTACQSGTVERQIILIDDVECLFLKKIGGIEEITQFFSLISATKPEILWIVTVNIAFYYLLKTILPPEGYFNFIHCLSGYSGDQLFATLEAQLWKLEYKIKIFADENIQETVKKRLKRKSLSYSEISGFIRSQYFEKYIQAGGPNFYFHQFYFLRSIKSVFNNTVTLSIPSFLEFPGLKNSYIESFFILQALIIHKQLSHSELADLLLQSPETVNRTLAFFCEYNVLEKTEDHYKINPPAYPEVIRLLNLKNLVFWKNKL